MSRKTYAFCRDERGVESVDRTDDPAVVSRFKIGSDLPPGTDHGEEGRIVYIVGPDDGGHGIVDVVAVIDEHNECRALDDLWMFIHLIERQNKDAAREALKA